MPGRFTPPMPGQALAAMGDERVDQRARIVPRRRMHHEPGRLVDDDEVVVLVDDGERDRLALRLRRRGRRHDERDARPACSLRPGSSDRRPVDRHLAVADERLQAAPRQVGEACASTRSSRSLPARRSPTPAAPCRPTRKPREPQPQTRASRPRFWRLGLEGNSGSLYDRPSSC